MKSTGKRVIEEVERIMPRHTNQKLWDFSIKEICKNLDCSIVDFCMDRKRYNAFKRRFNYFIKLNQPKTK